METKLFHFCGHRFSFQLIWNPYSEKYSLRLNNEDFNIGHSKAKIVVQLMSYSANHPTRKVNFTGGKSVTYEDFLGSTELESDAYVRDRQLTLNATITLPSEENLNRELMFWTSS
jgi:hypothetical protein